MMMSDKGVTEQEVISTGSIGLDMALGIGGLPKGRVVEIYGPESSGKTTLAIHVIAEAQKKGGMCAFIDAEHAFDSNYAQKLGVESPFANVGASLGYWLGQPHVGLGYMTDAVAAAVSYTIYGLRLHRIEAATLPDNAASIRVLERNGFRREGYANRFLKINGAWRDHVLFGLVAEDLRTQSAAGPRPDHVAAL